MYQYLVKVIVLKTETLEGLWALLSKTPSDNALRIVIIIQMYINVLFILLCVA